MNLDPRFDYPTHFTAISYTLMPEPPAHSIFVEDCAESDRPRQVRRETAFFGAEYGKAEGLAGCNGQDREELRKGFYHETGR